MIRLTQQVSSLVTAATGLDLPGDPTTIVIGREEWIERNVASFSHLMKPLQHQLTEKLEAFRPRGTGRRHFRQSDGPGRADGRLGVIARRVLGQYELVLPTGEDADVVAYVGPNILQLDRAHQFRPEEFRFWVALHELTHRAQFQGVPWLREYFMSLVTELVEHSRPEPGRMNRIIDEVTRRRGLGNPIIDERGLLGLFASSEQTVVIDKVQALMSLLEGHGHVVMDRLGREHLRTQARMSNVLKARRKDKRTAAFFRLTGMEMKMNQYRMGEQFIEVVEREVGWDAVGLAFRGAGSLPTLEEIESPERWLRRVA